MTEAKDAALAALCRLARLQLTPDRAAEVGQKLAAVMASFEPMRAFTPESGTSVENASSLPLRPDEPEPTLPLDAVLRNATRTAGDCFLVPRVVEG
jgi:aspartyl/glutamyl-tRNA(Asn/Gln) amidotransferase C subunit